MEREIAQQPAVLDALASRRGEVVTALRRVLPTALRGVCFAARGSSDNACVFGRYLVETTASVPTSLVAPSVATRHDAVVDYRGWLAVVVSQSGRTPELVTVSGALRAGGARVVAVVNDADAPLATAADVVVPLGAGVERSVPATKTFTAQVAAMALLAEALGPVPWGSAAWDALPDAVTGVVADGGPVADAVAGLDRPRLLTAGRGTTYAVALEAALKLKETAAAGAEGFAVPDLLHGPIAGFDPDVPAVLFAGDPATDGDTAELGALLGRRGHPVVTVAPSPAATLPLPVAPLGPLVAVVAAVRAQQLALHLALRRGLDVDAPRDLSKLTPTT